MNKLNSILAVTLLAITFTSCKKDDEPVLVIPPSDGSILTLNAEAAIGTGAANSVFVDLSADEQTKVLRTSWTLGFYSGSDFKVILNNTAGATAKRIEKTDLNAVTAADFVQSEVALDLMNPNVNEFVKIDDPRESSILNKTAIAAVSAIESENKVYLVSPSGGTHTSVITAETVYKVRILRKGDGYALQYAKLNETTFKTIDIRKDVTYNFGFVSLDEGKAVTVEPQKHQWDLVWSWSIYFGGGGAYPYGFSDVVFINSLGGTQAGEVLSSTISYDDFAAANIASVTFSGARNAIGDKWRSTQPATGITARFYVIKDASGNVYKLKFVSMGVGGDGGERGKPVIEYKLIKKG
ncbi:HmuY family protein [Pedobacter insulae]|uniref:HmuY protein n=1 Tax=Pedobacter insulae TaxID=414048 RepID=A0A1I2Y9P0_9SPHI|nr:HmuY family protein [Pedobacter insulae]SFH21081.1 HmuY protein [Pedobacter insulae]